jgi:tetraprenyl-beta-curcumene synthase
LKWWELAAACGSTLGIFALWSTAANEGPLGPTVSGIKESYFPWINGLHILLDYLIDQEEDLETGDMNFVSFYEDKHEQWRALEYFLSESLRRSKDLSFPELHRMVVSGLLAMYLSDPKVKNQGFSKEAARLIGCSGRGNRSLFHVCRIVRMIKKM